MSQREHPILFSAPMVRAILRGEKTQTRRIIKPQPPADYIMWTQRCPYGSVGDHLWVRETWRGGSDSLSSGLHYRADTDEQEAPGQWKPSIHMLRRDSRITLELTGVRVERLQDISEEDARAEGVQAEFEKDVAEFVHGRSLTASTYRLGFKHKWDEINGDRAPWVSNCFVWALEFKREIPAPEVLSR